MRNLVQRMMRLERGREGCGTLILLDADESAQASGAIIREPGESFESFTERIRETIPPGVTVVMGDFEMM